MTQYRLEAEYGVESRLEAAPWQFVRWLDAEGSALIAGGSIHLADNVRTGSDPPATPSSPHPWAEVFLRHQ